MRKLLLAALLLCSCGESGDSPTGLPSTRSQLVTQYGTAQVESHGLPYDPVAATVSVGVGYDRALKQRPEVIKFRIDKLGFEIQERIVVVAGNPNGVFLQPENMILVRQGKENVIEHELQHWFAYELGIRGSCYLYQDHAPNDVFPGSPGYDLNCNPR